MNLYEDDTLSCLICGLKSNQLISHVTRIHNLKPAEYYFKFPGSRLSKLTEAQKNKMRDTKLAKNSKNRKLQKEKQSRKEEVSSLGKLKCRLCEYESPLSLISHIMNKHHMKMYEYRELYPNDVVQRSAPSQLKKQSENMKARLEDEEENKNFLEWRSFPSEIKHWMKKGFSEEDAKRKVAEFQSSQSLKGNNDRTRSLRREKNLGDKNPMSLLSISQKNSVSLEEARKLTPCFGRSGALHPMFGKKHSQEAIRKIGMNINTTHKSKLEHEITNIIVFNYGGLKNEYVDGWCCDYVNHERKIVFEVFGDFWHHNPRKYNEDWVNPFTKRDTQYVRERDNRKIEELKTCGYQVIVIWEYDWRYDRENQLKRIHDAFNSV